MRTRTIFSLITIVSSLLLPLSVFAADERFGPVAEYNAKHSGVSLILWRGGNTLFEDYPGEGRPDRAYPLASGTKSLAGIMAAAAVQAGFLSLDEAVSDTLKSWQSDPLKKDITVRDLLTLTSGIDTPLPPKSITYQDAIDLDIKAEVGTDFTYGPAAFQIFGALLTEKLKVFEGGGYSDPVAFLEAKVFRPLGISAGEWRRDKEMPRLNSGAQLVARDWLKIGQLILAKGRHKGEQLLHPKTVSAFSIGSGINPAYGLTFWRNAKPTKAVFETSRTVRRATDLYASDQDLDMDVMMAAGAGKQRLYIIPQLDLVIVRQTDLIGRKRDDRDSLDPILTKYADLPPVERRAAIRGELSRLPRAERQTKVQAIRQFMQRQRGRLQKLEGSGFSDREFLKLVLSAIS